MPLVDTPTPGRSGSRRERVLGLLRAAGQGLSAAEVAEQSGLHLNTARFHLDALVEDGLAERTPQPRDVPGRPRILYSADGPMPGPRSYRLLAEMLVGLISSLQDSQPAAVEAGRAWGRHLIERATPSERVDEADALARLNRMLDAIGFRPEVRPSSKGQGAEVWLHHCPFREVAEKHTDVVCPLHLGLLQGALGELRAPVEATSLDPFVTPQSCLARLQPAS